MHTMNAQRANTTTIAVPNIHISLIIDGNVVARQDKNVAVNNAEEDVKEHSVYSNSKGGKIARQAISERKKKYRCLLETATKPKAQRAILEVVKLQPRK